MSSLAESENFEIFKSTVIRNIVQFKYQIVKKFTIQKLLVPYLFSLAVYFVYSDFVLPSYRDAVAKLEFALDKDKEAEATSERVILYSLFIVVMIMQGINVAFSFYFLRNEIK